MDLSVYPLTGDRWGDFINLFGEKGVGGGCWCMYWRSESRKEYIKNKGSVNKNLMHAIVSKGVIPGLIAYDMREPVGWCSIAPREQFPALDQSKSRRRVDKIPVWSITCIYVKRSYRGQSISSFLIHEAIEYVRGQGGKVVESYPVFPKSGIKSVNYAFTGFYSTFKKAGFKEVIRRTETRPVMRFEIIATNLPCQHSGGHK